jgi:selenocysteine lyase/cysteine desulfurase
VALAAAMRALQGTGLDAIAEHEAAMTAYALRRLRQVPGLRLYGCGDPARAPRRLGVIPFNLHGLPHEQVAALLADEHGIGLRNGCFCAHPYVAHLLGLSAQQVQQLRPRAERSRDGMPGLLRASLAMYNTAEEVDHLVAALTAISAGMARPRSEALVAGS